MKTVATLAFAGAALAQSSSSYVYSNPATAFTTLTDSRGVVTGIPTVNTDVNTNVVTSQPTLVTVPAGMGSPAATPYYPMGGSSAYPMGAAAPSMGAYPGTPGTPAGTPMATPYMPASTPSSTSDSDSDSSSNSNSGSASRSSGAPQASSTSGANAFQISGGLLGAVGLIFVTLL